VSARFGVTGAGHLDGRSVLREAAGIEELAASSGLAPADVARALETARSRLLDARSARAAPHVDDKVLAEWNGLAISAFAEAGLVLDEPAYVERARRAATFVLERMVRDGRLARSWAAGRASGSGYLEDHAFLVAGLLDLHEATGDPRWLREALALQRILDERFLDREHGGYFRTAADAEVVLGREKPLEDGALPSGNAVALANLLRLSELTTDDRFRREAVALLRLVAPLLERAPAAFGDLLLALDLYLYDPKEVVIVAPRSREEAAPFLDELRRRFVPDVVLVRAVEGPDLAEQRGLVPLLEGKIAKDGRATAYVCQAGACKLPTTEPAVFARQLVEGQLPSAEPAGR
jgi:uncharacterized protein YyaL (SSP411 family)